MRTWKLLDEDMQALEVEYRAGLKSVNALAKAFGIPEPSLRRLAKKSGWIRNTPELKRQLVANALAGLTRGLTSDEVRQAQEQDVAESVSDMELGLANARKVLRHVELTLLGAKISPKDLKTLNDANAGAIEIIRRIRSLDTPPERTFDKEYRDRIVAAALD